MNLTVDINGFLDGTGIANADSGNLFSIHARVVNNWQRQALIARDKGWKDGGPTDLHNLVLLCRRHHTLLHKSGWMIQMIDQYH